MHELPHIDRHTIEYEMGSNKNGDYKFLTFWSVVIHCARSPSSSISTSVFRIPFVI